MGVSMAVARCRQIINSSKLWAAYDYAWLSACPRPPTVLRRLFLLRPSDGQGLAVAITANYSHGACVVVVVVGNQLLATPRRPPPTPHPPSQGREAPAFPNFGSSPLFMPIRPFNAERPSFRGSHAVLHRCVALSVSEKWVFVILLATLYDDYFLQSCSQRTILTFWSLKV